MTVLETSRPTRSTCMGTAGEVPTRVQRGSGTRPPVGNRALVAPLEDRTCDRKDFARPSFYHGRFRRSHAPPRPDPVRGGRRHRRPSLLAEARMATGRFSSIEHVLGACMTAPGWYSDPQDGLLLRWWDGSQWTTHVQQVAPPAQPIARQPVTRHPHGATARQGHGAGWKHEQPEVLMPRVGGWRRAPGGARQGVDVAGRAIARGPDVVPRIASGPEPQAEASGRRRWA